MFRYMAFIWDVSDALQARASARLQTRLESTSSDWQKAFDVPGLSVYCAGSRPGGSQHCSLAGRSGVVVGTLFERTDAEDGQTGASALTRLTESESKSILASKGSWLISRYWGRYVAFLTDPNTHKKWVVKDPTGRLPCSYTPCDSVILFFSCVSDCAYLELPPFTLNWPYIRRRVAVSTGGAGETALNEVSEICGGERMEICHSRVTKTLLWRPLDIAASHAVVDPQAAAEEMRRTAIACTHAWLSGHNKILHRLSGGLDSSIVLGCSHGAPSKPSITCLTYYRSGGFSDERPWARLAAQRAGCAHTEQPRGPHLNFEKLLHMVPLARPPEDFSFLELSAIEQQFTDETSATAIFSGDGGDAILGSHSIPFAATDFFRRYRFHSELLNVASAVALLTHRSTWSVLARALLGTSFRNDRKEIARLREARRLVDGDAFATAVSERKAHKHPWFQSTMTPSSISEMLPFSALSDPFYDPLIPPEKPAAEPVCPLLSQPFVELCLRIPSYLHFEGGRDRGLARRAFASDVPSEILSRHWKDRAQGFPEEILLHGRAFVRELLLDGILVKEKLLDASLVDASLSGLRARNAVYVGEILDHVVTESWIRTWVGSPPRRPTSPS